MNWSEGSKGLVRGLLFSVVLLFAVSDFAVAQEKKPRLRHRVNLRLRLSRRQRHPQSQRKLGGGAGTHGPTTGGAGTHGPTTGGAGTHGPTTAGLARTDQPPAGLARTDQPPAGLARTDQPPAGLARTDHHRRGWHARTNRRQAWHAWATNTAHGGATNVAGHHPAGGSSKPGANGSTHNFTPVVRGRVLRPKSWHESEFQSQRPCQHHSYPQWHDDQPRRSWRTAVRLPSPAGVRVVGYGHGVVTPSMATTGAATPICGVLLLWWPQLRVCLSRLLLHGHPYFGFVPGVYYARILWLAYNPWAAPVAFGWGWGAAPWYGYYGYYFAPAPVYASPAFWITDLFAGCQSPGSVRSSSGGAGRGQCDAAAEEQPASGGGAVGLTPEVKQQIADEVRAQIAAQHKSRTSRTRRPVSSTARRAEARPAPMKFPPRWIRAPARSSCPRFLVNPHPTEPNVP